jgi:hypothetical protein
VAAAFLLSARFGTHWPRVIRGDAFAADVLDAPVD